MPGGQINDPSWGNTIQQRSHDTFKINDGMLVRTHLFQTILCCGLLTLDKILISNAFFDTFLSIFSNNLDFHVVKTENKLTD